MGTTHIERPVGSSFDAARLVEVRLDFRPAADLGKRFRRPAWRGGGWINVIGVVAHVRTIRPEIDPLPQVYSSYRQWTQDRMVLAVRSHTQSTG